MLNVCLFAEPLFLAKHQQHRKYPICQNADRIIRNFPVKVAGPVTRVIPVAKGKFDHSRIQLATVAPRLHPFIVSLDQCHLLLQFRYVLKKQNKSEQEAEMLVSRKKSPENVFFSFFTVTWKIEDNTFFANTFYNTPKFFVEKSVCIFKNFEKLIFF